MSAQQDVLDIAVGILRDARGHVLIAQRRPGTPGAGQWEFPGGKHEPGETLQETLARELYEELGVVVRAQRPLIRVRNGQAAQRVRLHVWLVSDWQGTPGGREGQRVQWCAMQHLPQYDWLPGNQTLFNALRLPAHYAVTPPLGATERRAWLASLQATLARGIRLLRLRQPGLDDVAYAELAASVVEHARAVGTQVLLDRDPDLVRELGAHGLHWSTARAAQAGGRPVADDCWFAVSAHDSTEVQAAARLGADFATLSPVHVTASHPRSPPLGWRRWQSQRADCNLPVYALGGLCAHDFEQARAHNAQGIAAIRAFWGSNGAG